MSKPNLFFSALVRAGRLPLCFSVLIFGVMPPWIVFFWFVFWFAVYYGINNTAVNITVHTSLLVFFKIDLYC